MPVGDFLPEQLVLADTLAALANHYGFDDADLGLHIGVSRQAAQHRRGGERYPRTRLTTTDVQRFAHLFGVPVQVLYMERSDAIRWVLDNIAGGGFPTRPGEEGARGITGRDHERRHLVLLHSDPAA